MRQQRHGSGKKRGRCLLLLLAACLAAHLPAAAQSSQVYKWTDAKGTVHYGDTPPPEQQQRPRTSLLKPVSPGGPEQDGGQAGALPYELARAVKANPVTLYTTTQCGGCDQGRALLRARGIPYIEKTVASDADKEQLRQLNGKLELPLLVVGSRKVAGGFQDAAWQQALSAAAYPRQAMLPSGYQYAAPEPAGGASLPAPPTRSKNHPPPDEAAARAAEQQPQKPPPAGNAPPNFQF